MTAIRPTETDGDDRKEEPSDRHTATTLFLEDSESGEHAIPSDAELAQWENFGNFLKRAMRTTVLVQPAGIVERIGRFAVQRRLGRGGSATVYLGLDPDLHRLVAVKVLHSGEFSSQDRQQRFLQEGKILSELAHPHIVSLYEYGFSDENPYLVLEYCRHGSLSDWLSQNNQVLSIRSAVQIIHTLAMAVHHAHGKGVLHRDLNPRNVLLSPLSESDVSMPEGDFPFDVKLSDFGLGTWLDERQSAVQTQTGAVMGTLPYMAPEQTKSTGQPLEVTVDVYSLGVMLYELLTQQRPFCGATPVDTLRLIHEAEPKYPRKLRRTIPRDLETICLRCLEKEPSKRYESAGKLAEDLHFFRTGNPIRARRTSPIERSLRWLIKRRAQFGLALLIVSLMTTIVVGGVWLLRKVRESTSIAQQFQHESEQFSKKIEEVESSKKNVEETKRQLEIQALADRNRVARLSYDQQIEEIGSLVRVQPFDAAQRLRTLIPEEEAEPDYRGFEWYFLLQTCGGDIAPLAALGPHEELEELEVDRGTGRIYAAHGKKLTEFDLISGRQPRDIIEFSQPIRDFAWSHQQSLLTVLFHQFKGLNFYDVRPDPLFLRSEFKDSRLELGYSIDFSNDEKQLIAIHSRNKGKPGVCQIWIARTNDLAWKPLARWSKGQVFDARFDPENRNLIIARNRVLSFMNEHGKRPDNQPDLVVSSSPSNLVQTLAVENSGKILAVSCRDKSIIVCRKNRDGVWEVQGRLPVPDLEEDTRDYGYKRNPVMFSSKSQRLFSGSDSNLQMWNIESSTLIRTMARLPGGDIRHLEMLPDQQIVAWGTTRGLGLWRPIEEIPAIAGHDAEAWTVAFQPHGHLLATGGDDALIRIWNLKTGSLVNEMVAHESLVTEVAFSPNGKLLASASFDGSIGIWDVASGSLLHKLTGHLGRVRSLIWLADGEHVASSDSYILKNGEQAGRLLVWHVESAKIKHCFTGFQGTVHQVLTTKSQQFLLGVSNDKSLRIWDLRTELMVHAWKTESPVVSATLLHEDRWIAAGEQNGSISIWELESGQLRKRMVGHSGPVICLAQSPDGRTLVSGGNDSLVKLWDSETLHKLAVLTDQPTQINSVAFSPDGTILASAAHDGTVKLRFGPRMPPLLKDLRHQYGKLTARTQGN